MALAVDGFSVAHKSTHEHGSGGVQRTHGQVAKLGWAIDHDHIVIFGNLIDCIRHTAEEQVSASYGSIEHGTRRVMLELH